MKPNPLKKFSTAIAVLTIVIASSCSKKLHPQKQEPAVSTKNTTGYEEAMVRYFKRDGCDYALQLSTGENLEPDKLPLKFQKDSLKVMVKYKERTDAASICMIGKMIKIIDIKKK
jgi:hypothetical protein